MAKISIVVVEDHPLFRQGVIDTLSFDPDFDVIGDSTNGDDGLDLILALQPDIAILDVNMPGKNGQQITNEVTGSKSVTKVILMTAFATEDQMIHAAIAGAHGFCSKDILPEELMDLVRTVYKGGYSMNSRLMTDTEFKLWLSEQLTHYSKVYSDPGNPLHPLSDRELEVLNMIVDGKSNKEIGNALSLSEQTIKNHVTSIFRKFGVEDRTQAVIYAMKMGWVKII